MNLREPLEVLCRRLDGALVASVVDADGLLIAAVRSSDLQGGPQEVRSDHRAPKVRSDQVESLWATYVALLDQVRSGAQMLAAGELEELFIQSTELTAVLRPINEHALLALAVRPEASPGKARYLCRVTAPRLVDALS